MIKVVWQAEYDCDVRSEFFENEIDAEIAIERKMLEGRISQVEWIIRPHIEPVDREFV